MLRKRKPGSRQSPGKSLAVTLALLAAVVVAGCSTDSSAATTTSQVATTTHATTTTAAPTTTTAAATTTTVPGAASYRSESRCRITSSNEQTDLEANRTVVFEHFSCVVTATDPRVSGQVEFDYITTVEPIGALVASFTGTGTLTNDGGTWRGTSKGALVFWGGHYEIDPYNYAESVLVGEGGYAGLTDHELSAGPNGSQICLGWIEAQG